MNGFKFFILGIVTGLMLILIYYFFGLKNQYVSKAELNTILTEILEIRESESDLSPGMQSKVSDISIKRGNPITKAIKKVSPSVVGINVVKVKKQYLRSGSLFESNPYFREVIPKRYYRKKVKSLGSGFIVSGNGYIITNEHVIHNAVEKEGIIVTTTDGKKHSAKIIGADEKSDIAVLKIDVNNHTYANLGDSDDILPGEWVIAFGNPYGLFEYNSEPTKTVGIISALGVNFGLSNDKHFYESMIQTDASINPGNSGGPLVNIDGDVIGLNTMIYSDGGGSIGIGFNIPINKVKEIKNILIKYGYVNRTIFWGFHFPTETSLETKQDKGEEVDGAMVIKIDPGSSAEKSGFIPGDIIVAAANYRVSNFEELRNTLFGSKDNKVGDVVVFRILRNGIRKAISMKLEPFDTSG